MVEFQEFPKIARLNRPCTITEKIDGTNAQIYISEDLSEILAGSRTKWVKVGDDNHGFAGWVEANKVALLTLGPGHHYGEWWGAGIQRKYGLANGDKRFSLFNVGRWNKDNIPPCVSVVPTLYTGLFSTAAVEAALTKLRTEGSAAVPGFMNPEGVVIYHEAARIMFKATLEKDEEWKGKTS